MARMLTTRSRPRLNGKSGPRIQSAAMRRAFSTTYNRMHYVPPLQDSRALIERLVSWAYICVEANASEVARIPLRLYTKDKKKAEKAGYHTKGIDPRQLHYLKSVNPVATDESVEIEEHAVLDLLAEPTPMLDGCNLLWLITAYLQLFGETFLYKGRNNLGVAELWPLPNQNVAKILGPHSLIDEYEYRYGGQMQKFPADDVCLIRKPSPIDLIAALAPLKAMLQSVETSKRYGEHMNAILQNHCVPDTLLIPDDDSVQQDQVDTLVAQWEAKHGGWRQRGGLDFMPYKMRVEQLGLNMRELQGADQLKAVREEIMAGFGVPATIATTDGATFANMKQGVQLWARKTISSYLTTIAHGLNRTLLPEFVEAKQSGRPSVFLAFDDPTPEDVAADTEIRIKRVRAGLMTLNQGIEQEGRAPVEGGDETLIEIGLQKLTDPTQAELAMQQHETSAVWRTEDHKREDVRIEYQQRVDGEAAEQEREATETRDRLVAEGMPGGGAAGSAGAVGGAAGGSTTAAGGVGNVDAGIAGPPEFNDLTLGAERTARMRDLELTNVLREAIAQRLGASISPLPELPSMPDPVGMKPAGDLKDEDSNGTGKPKDEKKPPGDEKPKPGGKAGATGVSGGGRGDDGERSVDNVHAERKQSDVFSGRVGCHDGDGATGCCGKVREPGALAKYVDGLLTKLALEDADPPDGAFAKVLQKLFREMEREVKKNLPSVAKACGFTGPPTLSHFLADAVGLKQLGPPLFNEDEWVKRFAAESQPFILEPVQEGAKAGWRDLERLGFQVPHGKPESREELEALLLSPEAAQQEALKLVDTFASKVVEVTGEELASAIIDGLDEGENLPEITKRVAAMYDGKVNVASKRIARTEVNNAANAGAAAQWKRAGIRRHKWLASSDACEFCITLKDKVVDIGTPFAKVGDTIIGKDGGRHRVSYRDVLQPGLHPNDRCTIVPVIEVPT